MPVTMSVRTFTPDQPLILFHHDGKTYPFLSLNGTFKMSVFMQVVTYPHMKIPKSLITMAHWPHAVNAYSKPERPSDDATNSFQNAVSMIAKACKEFIDQNGLPANVKRIIHYDTETGLYTIDVEGKVDVLEIDHLLNVIAAEGRVTDVVVAAWSRISELCGTESFLPTIVGWATERRLYYGWVAQEVNQKLALHYKLNNQMEAAKIYAARFAEIAERYYRISYHGDMIRTFGLQKNAQNKWYCAE